MKNQKGAKSEKPADKGLLTLKVLLVDGLVTEDFVRDNPIVSRTIKIRGSQTLEKLHNAIFDAFDREDEHLYKFEFSTGPRDTDVVTYVLPSMLDESMPTNMGDRADVTKTRVGSLKLEVGQTFYYMFDYGDGWGHQIDVLATDEEASKGRYPKVTERVGDSPPQYVEWDEEDEED